MLTNDLMSAQWTRCIRIGVPKPTFRACNMKSMFTSDDLRAKFTDSQWVVANRALNP